MPQIRNFLIVFILLNLLGACDTSVESVSTTVPAPPVAADLEERFAAIQRPSLEGSRENVQARLGYEAAMLADPATGTIPQGIGQRANRFASQLPVAADQSGKWQARTQATEWTERGPYNIGGRTRGVAIDVSNEDVLIAGGVSGGIWKSNDSGRNWFKATDPLSLHNVTALAQDKRPGKTNIWYHGSGELVGNTARGGGAPFRGDGLFKSVDGGDTWEPLPATAEGIRGSFNSQFQYIWNIAVHPDPLRDELYVAAFGGILRSTDEGNTWSVVLGDALVDIADPVDLNNANAAFFTDVTIATDGVIYAALSSLDGRFRDVEAGGLYRSEDGINWEEITPGSFPVRHTRTVIATSPSDPGQVWFLSEGESLVLLKYTFSGSGPDLTRTLQNLTLNIPEREGTVGEFDTQGSYNMLVKVHPANPDIVFLGGINLFRSTDGFRSQNTDIWIGGYAAADDLSPYTNHHPDQHGMDFYPSNPDRVISSHDGGLSRTDNIQATRVNWQSLNNGYRTSQFYSIAVDPTAGSPVIAGGMQDNGTYMATSLSELSNWSRLLGGDGAYTAITRDATYVYVSFQFSEIYRLEVEDGSLRSFARVDPDGAAANDDQGYLFVNPYILDPIQQNRMYLAAGNAVWRNDNLSQVAYNNVERTSVNWTELRGTRINRGQICALNVSRVPADVLYFGTTTGQLFKLEDADVNNIDRALSLQSLQFPTGGYVSHIAVDPLDANHILVVFSNYGVISLFTSRNGGESFTAVSGNLEENPDGTGNGPSVRWAEIIPMEDGSRLYYVGTGSGLFVTDNLNGSATEWLAESTDLIGNVVVPMIRYRDSDGTVVVATHGNGVYSREIDGAALLPGAEAAPAITMGAPYPQPFSTEVTIPFNLPREGLARARIYDYTGRVIKTILWSNQFAGPAVVSWDGTNGNNVPMPEGVYICRMELGDETVARQVILQR